MLGSTPTYDTFLESAHLACNIKLEKGGKCSFLKIINFYSLPLYVPQLTLCFDIENCVEYISVENHHLVHVFKRHRNLLDGPKIILSEYCVFITISMLKLNNSAEEITGVSIGCHCATHEYNNMFCPLCLSSQRMIQLTHITLSWGRQHVLRGSNHGVLTQGAATIVL